MTPLPQFNPITKSLRFLVPIGKEFVTAYLSETAWHARHDIDRRDASLQDLYFENQSEIDHAVFRKFSAGGRAPVVLRASDL
ncbi:hypothetical protein [Roseateles oligotrophus]|uniref:Uncharacterized protein n=1 Tax=Roseateles oligotrophus TaxID=1769250 RepID=A0ABT2YN17_9BURK|nr:hypothetical protein [Roseateles oligotrophus]MCV2371311.1 hypothetical protein [Roseateles oligotrophus]